MLEKGLEDLKPCRFGTCDDLFFCSHLDCMDEELPINDPAWKDSEVSQRLELASVKESMEELESVMEFVKGKVEELVSSESPWLKEVEQGPPDALEFREGPIYGFPDEPGHPQQVGEADGWGQLLLQQMSPYF